MDYCKKNYGILLFVFVLILCSPFCYSQQDKDDQQTDRDRLMQEKVSAAEQDIDAKLKPVLEHVNTGDSIVSEDIAILKDVLKADLPYVLRMQPGSQSKFYLLSAWTNFYENENQKAMQDSIKAFKADSGYADAQGTVAAMALMNRDYTSLTMLRSYYQKKDRPQQPNESKRRAAPVEQSIKPGGMPGKPGMEEMPEMPTSTYSRGTANSGEGVLNINTEFLIFDIINTPLGVKNFACLNNENLDMAAQERFYGILLWKINYLNTTDANQKSRLFNGGDDTENNSTTEGKSLDFEAFKYLYRESLAIDSATFVAVNTDAKPNKQAIVDFLLLNAGPWANAILLDPRNNKDSALNKTKIENSILILVRNNSILYAGPAQGILPSLIMKKQSGITFNNSTTLSTVPSEPADANMQMRDSNEIVKKENTPTIKEPTQSEPKDESQELTENIEAQKLYQLADMHFKKGRYIGYKKCIDSCREIIEKYPSTVEAQKAKEMLRQIPKDKRKLYGITDEELGL